MTEPTPSQRLDTWLDVSCLFRTRSQAQSACKAGKLRAGGERAKPHRAIRPGDEITISRGDGRKQVVLVLGCAPSHIPKREARLLYEEVLVPLEIRHEGTLSDAARWSLAPHGVIGRTFHFRDIVEGLMSVHLDVEDDLDADDRGAVLVLPPRAPRIQLVTEGNIFLKNALKTIPGVDVIEVSGKPEEGAKEEAFDVIVYDGVDPAPSRRARASLYFGTVPPGGRVKVKGELDAPLFGDGDWNETHPVNRYADFSSLFVNKALEVALPEDAVVLLESKAGPLIAAFEERNAKAVAVFFDVRNSDWPFQVSFPIFLSNAIFWLYGAGDTGAEGVWWHAGEPITLHAGRGRMATPSGRTERVRGAKGESASFSRTEEAGLYAFDAGAQGRKRYPVNLIAPAESDATPVTEIDLPGERVTALASEDVVYREYWPWLIVAALLVLLIEWWIYHRRAV